MVFIDGVKYACQRCIRGHRVTTCNHTDQQLIKINPKGRPSTQCKHCKEARKNNNHHAQCTCGRAKKQTRAKFKNSKDPQEKTCRCDDVNKCICRPQRKQSSSRSPPHLKSADEDSSELPLGMCLVKGPFFPEIAKSAEQPISPGFSSDWELNSVNGGNGSDVSSLANFGLPHQIDSVPSSLNHVVSVEPYQGNNIFSPATRFAYNNKKVGEVNVPLDDCLMPAKSSIQQPVIYTDFNSNNQQPQLAPQMDIQMGSQMTPQMAPSLDSSLVSPVDNNQQDVGAAAAAATGTQYSSQMNNSKTSFSEIPTSFDAVGHGLLDLFSDSAPDPASSDFETQISLSDTNSNLVNSNLMSSSMGPENFDFFNSIQGIPSEEDLVSITNGVTNNVPKKPPMIPKENNSNPTNVHYNGHHSHHHFSPNNDPYPVRGKFAPDLSARLSSNPSSDSLNSFVNQQQQQQQQPSSLLGKLNDYPKHSNAGYFSSSLFGNNSPTPLPFMMMKVDPQRILGSPSGHSDTRSLTPKTSTYFSTRNRNSSGLVFDEDSKSLRSFGSYDPLFFDYTKN